jgi:hypothetical protein
MSWLRAAVLAAVVVLGAAHGAATAAAAPVIPTRPDEIVSAETALRWIYRYRPNADVAAVPSVVHRLSHIGALRDSETSGIYIGFIAGVIGAHPGKARALIAKMFPLAPEDEWALVRAIAYSGLPDWKDVLREIAPRLPTRGVMIDKYLAGKLPTLTQLVLVAEKPSFFQKMKASMSWGAAPEKPVRLEPTPDLLDTLWGYYFATRSYGPIARIARMLPWSKDRDELEWLTIGSMAKYTLATNAAKDRELLALLQRERERQPKDVKPILAEVIDAAETMDLARIRKEAHAAVAELRMKGPASQRDMAWWGKVGEGAIALGCIAAAATGQVEFGLPCVVGGALSSATLRYMASP